MGAAIVNILILHFKQNVSHVTSEHNFGAGNVGASTVEGLPPQDYFLMQRWKLIYIALDFRQ